MGEVVLCGGNRDLGDLRRDERHKKLVETLLQLGHRGPKTLYTRICVAGVATTFVDMSHQRVKEKP